MPINFNCPHCGHATLVEDCYAGQTGPCANCRQTITIPDGDSPFSPDAIQANPYMSPAAAPVGAEYARPALEDNAGIRMLLPVGRSPLAIIAGYLGLVSVLTVPAPLALLFGILAIRDIRRNPEKHGMGRAIFGVVMGVIFSVFLLFVVIGLLANL